MKVPKDWLEHVDPFAKPSREVWPLNCVVKFSQIRLSWVTHALVKLATRHNLKAVLSALLYRHKCTKRGSSTRVRRSTRAGATAESCFSRNIDPSQWFLLRKPTFARTLFACSPRRLIVDEVTLIQVEREGCAATKKLVPNTRLQ